MHGNKNKKLTDVHKTKIGNSNRGKVRSIETILKLKDSHKGQIPWAKGKSWKVKDKSRIVAANKKRIGQPGYWRGKKIPEDIIRRRADPRFGVPRPISEEHKQKNRINGATAAIKAYAKIDKEVLLLEEQGFKCIPIGRVIPDIIAIKDGKIYAIEIEYGRPNYSKYDKNNYRDRFDDVLWLLRKRS